MNSSSFYTLLSETAEAHEFPAFGALDLDTVLAPGGAFQPHIEKFDTYIAQGHEGEMGYLRRGRDRRADPRLLLPSAKSIFCVAVPYERKPLGSVNAAEGPRYARYLRGKDYHDVLPQRLENMMIDVARKWAIEDPLRAKVDWKVCVDTSAVLERSWSALTGIGWIGKNTTLIHPKLGSYLFLGEVLLSEEVGRGPTPLPNYCGNCTRCLEGCPTGAFVKPGSLDSRRCISYWTLEKRGELLISDADKKAMGNWVAGCDICQEVCPFNIKPAREEISGIDPNHLYADQADATLLKSWSALDNESIEDYQERVKISSLNRVKPEQFKRNLDIARANAKIDAGTSPSIAHSASHSTDKNER